MFYIYPYIYHFRWWYSFLYTDVSIWCPFHSVWIPSLQHSYRKDLLVMNFLSFHLSEKLFHLHYWRYFNWLLHFQPLKMLFYCILSIVSVERSVAIDIIVSYMLCFFHWLWLSDFFLDFAFSSFTMICLGVFCLFLTILGFSWASWICTLVLLIKLRNTLATILSKMF